MATVPGGQGVSARLRDIPVSLWIVLFVGFVVGVILVIPRPQTTLTILGEDSSNLHAMESLAAEYEKETGVKVRFVRQTFDELQRAGDSDLQSGAGTYDIILNYNFSLAPYVNNGWVYTLSELKALVAADTAWRGFESDIFESSWREVGYYRRNSGPSAAEEPIGYPFASNTMLLCYNRRLFEDAGNRAAYRERYHEELVPPRDWEHFRRAAEFFSTNGNGTRGVAMQGGAGGWLYYEWLNFAFGMGGGVLAKRRGWEGDEHTPLLLDRPETVTATRFWLGLKPFNAGDFLSTGAIEQQEQMRSGNVAMAIMWSDYVYGLLYDGAQHENEFGFLPIPGNRSMLAGGAFYVNRRSRHPREAAAFIMWLMQRPRQVRLMGRGLASPLRSAYSDTASLRLPYAQALKESLDRGVYMAEAGPDATIVQETLTKHLQRIWRGEVPPEEGLRDATQELKVQRDSIYAMVRNTES